MLVIVLQFDRLFPCLIYAVYKSINSCLPQMPPFLCMGCIRRHHIAITECISADFQLFVTDDAEVFFL